jgi:hypothetical protein
MASAIVLVLTLAARLLAPPSIVPRVNVRWSDNVTEADRLRLETDLRLLAGEQREGTTWAYDLGDPSWRGVRRLIAEPAVADTHYLNRRFGLVSRDAPKGTTQLSAGPLSRWRDSAVAGWTVRLSLALLVVSTAWLAVNGRTTRVPPRPPA